MNNRRNQGKKWSITNHVIWPLLYFAAGIMVASSFLMSHHSESSETADAVRVALETTTHTQRVAALSAETGHKKVVAALEDEVKELEEHLAEMAAQRDAWKDKAANLAAAASAAAAAAASAAASVVSKTEAEAAGGEDWSKEMAEEQAWAAQVGGGGGSSGSSQQAGVKWSPLNKWHTTELEPLGFSKLFDIGLPIDTIKWSGGFLMMPNQQKHKASGGGGGGNSGNSGGLEERGTALDHIQHSCPELDVMVLNDQHCVAVTHVNGAQAGQNTPYHIHRFVKGGGGGGGGGKKQNDPESNNQASQGSEHDKFSLVSRLGSREGAPPGPQAMKTHRKSLARFFASVDEVEAELAPILASVATTTMTVVTMTMNAGMSDLVLNFACSARRNIDGDQGSSGGSGGGSGSGGGGSMLDHLVLFPTDDEAVEVAKSLGVAHYRHPSFGKFPTEEAGSYGDNTFVAMMWIKVLCVYLPVNLGYNVLFQDADVVWLRDPINEFFAKPQLAGDFDVYFQDDGSRSTRFSPYFSNSGFYFLRQTPRTRYFMTMLLYEGDTILEWRSHQAALVQVLADASSKFGLKVKTLSYKDFPSGKDYHHRKPFMQAWAKGEEKPYAFHMCWTQNKVDKVKYLKQLGGWFMDRSCTEDSIRTPELQGKGALQDTCCSAEPVVDCFFKDKASVVPCKDSPTKDKGQPSWW